MWGQMLACRPAACPGWGETAVVCMLRFVVFCANVKKRGAELEGFSKAKTGCFVQVYRWISISIQWKTPKTPWVNLLMGEGYSFPG